VDKQDRRVGRKMLSVYQEVEPALKKRAEQIGATCRKGCHHCCNLLVVTTFPEAVAVAEKVLTDESMALLVRALPDKLFAQVQSIGQFADKPWGEWDAAYFKLRQPCVFLRDGECLVYDARPVVCRAHMVISDPALCSPEVESKTKKVLTDDVYAYARETAAHVSRQVAMPLWAGPFPIMLLWALKLLKEGRQAIEKAHATEKLGIMDLSNWRVHPSGFATEEFIKGTAPTPETPAPAPEENKQDGTRSP
jgi:Fe-S-cluster containining protein